MTIPPKIRCGDGIRHCFGPVSTSRNLHFGKFSLRSIILCDASDDISVCTAKQAVKPEEIEGLKPRQKSKRDDLSGPRFILLRLPVEFERPNQRILGNNRIDDPQAQVVARVYPDQNTQNIRRYLQRMVNVIQGL